MPVQTAHEPARGGRLRLSSEELAIVRKARCGSVSSTIQLDSTYSAAPRAAAANRLSVQSRSKAAEHSSTPYPAADVRTLELLGMVDALMKAPPAGAVPRSALLKVLSIMEEFREQAAVA